MAEPARPLPPGWVAFVKRDCPTCALVTPVLEDLAKRGALAVYCQDDPAFPETLAPRDDRDLAVSWQHGIEVVPSLLRVDPNGTETARAIGWHRGEWESVTGQTGLGLDLPETRPGCGSLTLDPTRETELRARYEGDTLRSRRVEIAELEDEHEAMFARGWSDGLPVVPPTPARVLAMLGGTTRAPDEVVAVVPPDLVPCTVEKVAVNAVLAGCRPEYLPVVLAALAAVCTDRFNIHGVQATTMGATPTLVVNGPIRQRIGMNSGTGALGVGNRANATIGRALQLVIRNVGGSRRGTDRSTYGHPGKLGFCFAEQEEGSPFPPLSAAFGIEPGRDAVTAFASEGPRLIVDQISRDADSLLRSFAECLRTVHHPKLGLVFSALLVIGPEHARVLSEGGLGRDEVLARLHELTSRPGATWTRGADGIAEGLPLPAEAAEASIPKFRPGNLQIAHAGGGAGLFSVILGGWLTGPEGSLPVAVEIGS